MNPEHAIGEPAPIVAAKLQRMIRPNCRILVLGPHIEGMFEEALGTALGATLEFSGDVQVDAIAPPFEFPVHWEHAFEVVLSFWTNRYINTGKVIDVAARALSPGGKFFFALQPWSSAESARIHVSVSDNRDAFDLKGLFEVTRAWRRVGLAGLGEKIGQWLTGREPHRSRSAWLCYLEVLDRVPKT
jgi:hypothetical protein